MCDRLHTLTASGSPCRRSASWPPSSTWITQGGMVHAIKHVAFARKITTFIIFNRSFGAPDEGDGDEGEDEVRMRRQPQPSPSPRPSLNLSLLPSRPSQPRSQPKLPEHVGIGMRRPNRGVT